MRAAAPGFAQDQTNTTMMNEDWQDFGQIDADQSGNLTYDEIGDVMDAEITLEDFDAADADLTGDLDEDEYDQLGANWQQRRNT